LNRARPAPGHQAAGVDGDRVHGGHGQRGLPGAVHGHRRPRAAAAADVAVDDVAVRAGRQARADRPGERAALAVDRQKAGAAAAERNLVAAVGPPVRHRREADRVAEADHVRDRPLPVLAHPTVAAADVPGGVNAVAGRAGVVVAEREAGHDHRRAVRPGQLEDVRQCVGLAVLVGQDVAGAGPLRVVVVGEHQRLAAGLPAGLRAQALQAGDLRPREGAADRLAVSELEQVTVALGLAGLDRLAGTEDDLLVDVRRPAEPGQDVGDVGGRHVLGRVDAEAVDAEGEQVVEVGGEPALHVVGVGGEVGQVDELAVLHLPSVAVVGDVIVAVAAAVVEVLHLVDARVVVVAERRAGAADGAGRPAAGHVVDYRVGVDLDPGGVAGGDHVGELLPAAAAGGQLVADRLVPLPPGVAPVRQHDVLLRRGRLGATGPLGAEHRGALPGDVGPI